MKISLCLLLGGFFLFFLQNDLAAQQAPSSAPKASTSPLHQEKPFQQLIHAHHFWENNVLLTNHLDQKNHNPHLAHLNAHSFLTPQSVRLTYSFFDHDLCYIGHSPTIRHDSLLQRIGYEWKGIDHFLEYIAHHVVAEALWPDSSRFLDPENLEPLQRLANIGLSAKLNRDEPSSFLDAGLFYEGELGIKNLDHDTLFIDIVLNGLDTTLAIRSGESISHLELAALKLDVMRKKLEYELISLFEDKVIVKEASRGHWIHEENIDHRDLIIIRPYKIETEEFSKPYLQEASVSLKFIRSRK